MKLKDRILELAVKKLAREATVEELRELDDLLNKDPDASAVLRLLLAKWTTNEQMSKEDTDRNFAKLMTRIRSAGSHQIPKTATANYKWQHKRELIILVQTAYFSQKKGICHFLFYVIQESFIYVHR